ncbi:MAG: hypothetical protein ACREIC_04540 [Limisphaerales bacterium]
MEQEPLIAKPSVPPVTRSKEAPFGVNEVRLNAWQWFAALGIVAAFLFLTPRVWEKIERFKTGSDYRIPYQLSKDYWLY